LIGRSIIIIVNTHKGLYPRENTKKSDENEEKEKENENESFKNKTERKKESK